MASMREDLVEYSKKLSEKNMVIGPGGNTSIREGDFMYIKPSGLSFPELTVDDLVEVEIATGTVTPHHLKPSSEVLLHLYIYQVRDVNCIFHAHPPFVNGITARDIPFRHMFPDSVVYLGRTIPVIDYCVPCTETLAEYVRDNFQDSLAIVLKNHGAITVGENPKTAYLRMEILEGLAYTIWIAKSINDVTPLSYLSDQDIEDVLALDSEKYRQNLLKDKK